MDATELHDDSIGLWKYPCLALGFPADGAKPLATHNSRKPIEETVTYL